jgi:hypothetical protein
MNVKHDLHMKHHKYVPPASCVFSCSHSLSLFSFYRSTGTCTSCLFTEFVTFADFCLTVTEAAVTVRQLNITRETRLDARDSGKVILTLSLIELINPDAVRAGTTDKNGEAGRRTTAGGLRQEWVQ